MNLFGWFKKVSLIGLLLVVGMVSLTSAVWARDPVPFIPGSNPPQRIWYYRDVFRPAIESQDVNLQSTVYEIYLSLLSSMHDAMYECDPECLAVLEGEVGLPRGDTGEGAQLASMPRGLIPWLWNMNAAFLSRPAISSTEYLAYVGERLHLVSPAYAQAGAVGFGYEGLAPVRQVWTAFRNVAYLIATIGFVALSFMIMFRIRISAQTTIGAQQAIVKLVVVFLTITFSYAIAGLIIDLIFILTFLVITLFISTGLITSTDPNPPLAIQTALLSGNIFHAMGALLGSIQQGGAMFTEMARELFNTIGFTAGSSFISWVNNLFGLGTIDIIGAIIIGIAVIYALFRLLFALLFSYLEILILVILAPLMILPDILPGGKAFMGWLRRLFANAMVFPVTTFMLLLGVALVGSQKAGLTSGVTINLDQEGLRLPYLSGFSPGVLQAFLGIGMILMTYKVVDMVKNALKVSSFQYSSAIGAALGAGAAGAGLMATPLTYPAGQVAEMGRAGIRAGTRDLVGGTLGKIPGVGSVFKKGQTSLERSEAQGRGIASRTNTPPPNTSKN